MGDRILIVEDDEFQQDMLATLLKRKLGISSEIAGNGREALQKLAQDQNNSIKAMILDLNMPVMNGLETLQIAKQQYPDLPIIMLTGNNDTEKAADAIKLGAIDFISKPVKGERLLVSIKNAMKISVLSREVTRLKSEKDGTFKFNNLIGYDSGLASAVKIGTKAAQADIPVLITGETGTGKDVFARAIHGESPRAGKPFIAVNCGAIPAQLVESVLFGHEKGAFTGATEKTIGKFREADGGTIFLDEVGELPKDTQVKLLRVLQQQEVEPVGATTPVKINVRILSATNRNLEKDIKDGLFREDLYFRLNVLEIKLPPLRDRKEDIEKFATHFMDRRTADGAITLKALPPETLAFLKAQAWPGNVRQLENAINRAIVMDDTGILQIQDFHIHDNHTSAHKTAPNPENNARPTSEHALGLLTPDGQLKTMNEIEQEVIKRALDLAENNVTKAAQSLGMAKSTFYKKIKQD